MKPHVPRPQAARRSSVLAVVAAALLTLSPFGGGRQARAATDRLAPATGAAVRRFLLVVDSSNGGSGRPVLRYPASDGESVARVLSDLGGVGAAERLFLHEADRAQLQAGFARITALVRAARPGAARTELVFYYSGHSDEDGLLLGGERVAYDELRALIEQTAADVRIAILDSCASGALTRHKGGVRRPPFLIDSSTHASGHAFLTASSENEAAQESDRIGAAFFTHYLVSGLRGAADSSRDGRVTLNEAYQYAFHETLARTEKTSGGPQHATYDIQLAGTGDLVMTDLHESSSSLVVADPVAGRLFVRDHDGHLVAELFKTTAHPVELGLEPGQYNVTLEGDQKLWTAEISLRAGARTNLTLADLRPLTPALATARGGAPAAAAPDAGADVAAHVPAAGPAYRLIPVNLSLVPPLSFNGKTGQPSVPVMNNFALGVITQSDLLRGAQLSLAANLVGQAMVGAQLSVAFNLVDGDGRGLQASAGANVARGDFLGVQAASATNVAMGRFRGLQAAAGLNVANGPLHGVQLAVVNVGADVEGTQIGVINIAGHVHGLQLGVVNVADQVDGAPIGVLSVVRHGYMHLEGWSSETAAANVGLKMGGRRFYSILAAGFHRPNSARGADAMTVGDRWSLSAGLGLGGHIDITDAVYVDTDLMGWGFQKLDTTADNDNAVLGTLRVMVGWQLAAHLALFAGPSLNVLTSWSGKDLTFSPDFAERVIHDGSTTVRIYPGITAGIRI